MVILMEIRKLEGKLVGTVCSGEYGVCQGEAKGLTKHYRITRVEVFDFETFTNHQ